MISEDRKEQMERMDVMVIMVVDMVAMQDHLPLVLEVALLILEYREFHKMNMLFFYQEQSTISLIKK